MTQIDLRDLISLAAAALAVLGLAVTPIGLLVAGLATGLVGLTALVVGAGTLLVQRRRSRLRALTSRVSPAGRASAAPPR